MTIHFHFGHRIVTPELMVPQFGPTMPADVVYSYQDDAERRLSWGMWTDGRFTFKVERAWGSDQWTIVGTFRSTVVQLLLEGDGYV